MRKEAQEKHSVISSEYNCCKVAKCKCSLSDNTCCMMLMNDACLYFVDIHSTVLELIRVKRRMLVLHHSLELHTVLIILHHICSRRLYLQLSSRTSLLTAICRYHWWQVIFQALYVSHRLIDRRYNPPSRSTVTSHLGTMAENVRQQLSEKLAAVQPVNLTLNILSD